MRKSTLFGIFVLILFLSCIGTLVETRISNSSVSRSVAASKGLVKKLGLTDPALFTEASYIRHLSQADRHTAFQDHPTGLEHFPSGALIQPPAHLRQ